MIPCEAIINSLDEAIVLFNGAALITYLNRTAEELFGRGSRGLIGKTYSSLLRGEKVIAPLIKKTIAEGRSFRGKSVSLPVGSPMNVDFSLSPLYLENRIEGAVLSVSRNLSITGREDLDFDSMVFLIGSIAHEIKNPLGGIKGAAQLLRHKAQDASIREYTDLIIRETDRLNIILRDYLTMCRKPTFSQLNVHEVIERAVSVMKVVLLQKGITIRRLYDPSLPLISGDEAKLFQVFLNIIKNAIEAVRKGGMLEITTSPSMESFTEAGKKKRWASIVFRDNGKGIPQEELNRIFLPFHTKKKGGTGIGLAVSNKIIKDHRGFIRVDSELRRGTAFFIYLPFGEQTP